MKLVYQVVGMSFVTLAVVLGSAQAEPPPHRQPPPAAFEACSSASQGDACTVTFHERELKGTCEPFGDGGLACRPERPAPPPAAFEACSEAAEGDSCKVTFGERELEGTCHAAGDQGLACRPNHPPHHDRPAANGG
jgi:hypothetical protein